MATIRRDLSELTPYKPGASIPGALKLASNESPFGLLPGVAEVLDASTESLNIYPDNSGAALKEALGAKFGLAPENIALGNGSVTLCQQVIQAFCERDQSIAFGWRSFEAYPVLARAVGVGTITVPNTADHRQDTRALAAAINAKPEQIGAVFLCTPNNPTGTTITREEILEFLEVIPENILVVLDEAYREFARDDSPDGTEFLRDEQGEFRSNVVVLRTFSKAYGLAALRVGYALGHREIIAALNAVQVPFSVNSLALAAATSSLSQEQEASARIDTITAERERVLQELTALDLPVVPSQANFLWLALGEQSQAFDDFLRSKMIIARCFADSGVRVTVSLPEHNDLFLEAARQWAKR